MVDNESRVNSDRQLLREAQSRGSLSTLGAYFRLSGPGWLQSAITLGGGSLASSLILGILGGYSMLWLQPLAMILGIIMLSAIGYITLSTGEQPFRAINRHVNPVLGWGWALAVFAANIVWCLPQYTLATSVTKQLLLEKQLGADSPIDAWAAERFGSIEATTVADDAPWAEYWSATATNWLNEFLATNMSTLAVVGTIFVLTVVITWSYDRGGWGLRLYETLLKILVAIIVLCFVGVVVKLGLSGQLPWDKIGQGLIPNFNQIFNPAATFTPILNEIQNVDIRAYWAAEIVERQQGVIISAAATAVGINMTFLFPYSLLRKGWTREFRGLATFDLCTGMFIPYVLATGCVVIASAAQFHTAITDDFVVNEETQEVTTEVADLAGSYQGILDKRTANASEGAPIEFAEKKLAAMLVDRKAHHLSKALDGMGPVVARMVFGVGVLAMALSTISILMLISGFVFTAMLGCRPGGWVHMLGTLFSGIGGTLGPFIWSKAGFYLAIPTSVFGFILLPFAYVTFLLLINRRSFLGDDTPRSAVGYLGLLLMLISALVASVGSLWMVWQRGGAYGIPAVLGFVFLAVVVAINRRNERRTENA